MTPSAVAPFCIALILLRRHLPWTLAGLCFLWRFLALLAFVDSPLLVPEGGDTRFYADWALRITQGEFSDGYAFYGLPGYSWFLAGLFAIFGFNPFVPALVQITFDAWLTGLLVAWVRRLPSLQQSGTAELSAGAAGVLWILFVPATAFSIILMPTLMVVAIYWLLIDWAARTKLSVKFTTWFLLGILVGFVAQIIATIFFVLPILLARAWQRSDNSPSWSIPSAVRRTVLAALLLVAGALIGCSPSWLHNWLVAKDPVLLTAHSGLNLFIGNNADATGYPRIPPGMSADQKGMLLDSITFAEQAEGRSLKRSEVSAFWADKAKAWIAENPTDYAALLGTKLRNFWNAFEYDDLSITEVLQDQKILRPGVHWGLLVTFAFAGIFLLIRSRERNAGWMIAGIVLHMLSLMTVFITERYRLAAAPGLAMLAGVGLAGIASAICTRQFRRLILPGIGALIGLAMTAFPLPPATVWGVGDFNAGLANLRLEQFNRARTRLERALAHSPGNPEVIFSLANYYREVGDRPIAAHLYKRTLDLNPRHHRAANNLAVMLVAARQFEKAKPLLKYAVELNATSPESYFLLAQVELATEQPAAALRAIKQALRLAPGIPAFLKFRDVLLKNHPELLKAGHDGP